MNEIRLLEPSDIEVRAQQVTEKGAALLLYKNARVDMAILDEQFGIFGWQREHFFKDGKNYCRVSIWDGDNKQWVTKEDIGTESNTEKEKGEASDAFKRACVNIGIGRELYTAPFIWIALAKEELSRNEMSNRWQLRPGVNFEVKRIAYDSKRSIKELEIVDHTGRVRFTFPKANSATGATSTPPPKPKKRITNEMLDDNVKQGKLLEMFYGRFAKAGYPAEWDVAKNLTHSFDADGDVVKRFSELFESYRQAMNNGR